MNPKEVGTAPQTTHDPVVMAEELRIELRRITCEWKNLTDIIRDMSPSYSHGLQIDRKDNDGPYSKDNCRWLTPKLNSNNKRTNI